MKPWLRPTTEIPAAANTEANSKCCQVLIDTKLWQHLIKRQFVQIESPEELFTCIKCGQFIDWCKCDKNGDMRVQAINESDLKTIRLAIKTRLEFGYVDGYCYDEDSWELIRVRQCRKQQHGQSIISRLYYAFITINTVKLDESNFACVEVEVIDRDNYEVVLVGSNDDPGDGDIVFDSDDYYQKADNCGWNPVESCCFRDRCKDCPFYPINFQEDYLAANPELKAELKGDLL